MTSSDLEARAAELERLSAQWADQLSRVDGRPGDARSRAATGEWVPSEPEMLAEPDFCAFMRMAWRAGRGEMEPNFWAIYQAKRGAQKLRDEAAAAAKEKP